MCEFYAFGRPTYPTSHCPPWDFGKSGMIPLQIENKNFWRPIVQAHPTDNSKIRVKVGFFWRFWGGPHCVHFSKITAFSRSYAQMPKCTRCIFVLPPVICTNAQMHRVWSPPLNKSFSILIVRFRIERVLDRLSSYRRS